MTMMDDDSDDVMSLMMTKIHLLYIFSRKVNYIQQAHLLKAIEQNTIY